MCIWECSTPRGKKRASDHLELDDSDSQEYVGKQGLPLQEQWVLLTTESSLQSPFSSLKSTKTLMKSSHNLLIYIIQADAFYTEFHALLSFGPWFMHVLYVCLYMCRCECLYVLFVCVCLCVCMHLCVC